MNRDPTGDRSRSNAGRASAVSSAELSRFFVTFEDLADPDRGQSNKASLSSFRRSRRSPAPLPAMTAFTYHAADSAEPGLVPL
jgi:hypothetical protein